MVVHSRILYLTTVKFRPRYSITLIPRYLSSQWLILFDHKSIVIESSGRSPHNAIVHGSIPFSEVLLRWRDDSDQHNISFLPKMIEPFSQYLPWNRIYDLSIARSPFVLHDLWLDWIRKERQYETIYTNTKGTTGCTSKFVYFFLRSNSSKRDSATDLHRSCCTLSERNRLSVVFTQKLEVIRRNFNWKEYLRFRTDRFIPDQSAWKTPL